MRKVEQVDISYSNDEYEAGSVFVGVCKSEELLKQYMEKDYDLLEDDYIGFELGIDFGINTYDEDFMVRVFHNQPSNRIDDIFKYAEIFDLSVLKEQYPDGLEQLYNAVIIICGMKYEGNVKEVDNKDFGYFKFLGYFEN